MAGQLIPTFPGTFKLQNGKIPEELLKSKLQYQSYISYLVPGLKGVLTIIRWHDQEERKESQNGVADKTCTLYPANNPYFDPNVLFLSGGIASDQQDGTEGEVTLYFSSDKSIFATYDLLTGNKIGSGSTQGQVTVFSNDSSSWIIYDLLTGKQVGSGSKPPPPPPPLVLTSALVQVDERGQVTIQGEKSATLKKFAITMTGIKLRLSGPVGTSAVIEYTDRLGGTWQELTTVPLTYGLGEYVYMAPFSRVIKFFRARLGN